MVMNATSPQSWPFDHTDSVESRGQSLTQETSDDRYRNCEELMQALERAGKPPKKAVHRLFRAIYRA